METSPLDIEPPDIAMEVSEIEVKPNPNVISGQVDPMLLETGLDNYRNPNFWATVRENLVSTDHFMRKQAVYKFAKAIEALKLQNEKPDDSLKVPFLCDQVHSHNIPMETLEASFFLIYEALEETQKHLIVPALSHLHGLIRANVEHECFDDIWLQVIFQRLLQHENNSIVKIGVSEVCRTRLSLFDEGFLELLLSVLNNTYLYESEVVEKDPPTITLLATLFQRAEEADDELTRKFLTKMPTLSWGPVAAFYVLRSLNLALCSRRSEKNVWDKETLLTVQKLAQSSITMHSKTLRIAFQLELLLLITNYSKRCLDLESLGMALHTFMYSFLDKVLKRGNYAWIRICLWLGETLKPENASNFVQRNCDKILHSQDNDILELSCPAFAIMLMLLFDSKIVLLTENCSARRNLITLFDNLRDFNIRLYANKPLIDRIVILIGSILRYSKSTTEEITSMLTPYLDEIAKYLVTTLKHPPRNFDFDEFEQFLKIYKAVFAASLNMMAKTQYENMVQTFHDAVEDILKNIDGYYNMQHYFALYIKLLLKDLVYCPMGLPLNGLLELYSNILFDQEKWLNIKGKAASKWYKLFAMLLMQNLESRPIVTWHPDVDVIKIIATLLDKCDDDALPFVSWVLSIIAREYCGNSKKKFTQPIKHKLKSLQSLMKICWKKILLVSQKTFDYEGAIRNISLTFLSPQFLAMEGVKEIVNEFVEEFMKQGEKAPAFRKFLLTAMVDLPSKDIIQFIKHLITCLTHGSVPRLDQRIEKQTCFYIERKYGKEYQDEFAIWNCDIDATIRAVAASALHDCLTDQKFGAVVLPPLLEKLTASRCKRYYGNSQFHRNKNRILQSLLIMVLDLNKPSITKLHDVLGDLLINESNQHSVRLMMEWILIRIYLKYPDLRTKLWTIFEEVTEKRPSNTRSLATITYHVANNLSGEHLLKFAHEAMTYIIPCCLGQQFSMRLYNQVVFVKIYNLLQETHGAKVVSNYEILYKATQQSLKVGNLLKNATDMENDFFFTSFHPKRSYSIETIYYELPRLTNLPRDEWICPELFITSGFEETNIRSLKLRNPDNRLSEATVPPYILKSTESEANTNVDVGTNNSLSDIQKKASPWKCLIPNGNEVDEISRLREKVMDQNGITVVASLIDRIPNLGGLARTCEILGAKELVISTLAHINNKEFQNLSVSAEKWITLIEVASHELKNYLLEKKEAGYILVGVEQTANSTSLSNYKFEKNTVLLLGNEKSGIPANFIPLMDQCVQIPQLGIIRSLNVHVTGAICLWEYAKQHNFKDK